MDLENNVQIELEIEIERKDYMRYNRYYIFGKGLKKRLVLLIIIALILTFWIMSISTFSLFHFIKVYIISVILFGSLYFIFSNIGILLSGLIPLKNGQILGKKIIKLDSEGINEKSNQHSYVQKWEGIQTIEENRKYIYVFVDNAWAYIIPKRFFSSKNDQEDFVKFMRSKLKD